MDRVIDVLYIQWMTQDWVTKMGKYGGNDQEICEDLNASFHEVFTTEREQLPVPEEEVKVAETLSHLF